MASRARAKQHLHHSSTALSASVRPLCRAIAVMLAAGMTAHAHAGMVNLSAAGGRPAGGAGGAGGAGVTNLGVSPQQALQLSQPSIRNLAHAAQGIAQQIAAQQAAAAAAANAANVPNGLAPGGLQVAPGVSADTNNPNLWINANAPRQSVDASGHVTVEVDQTSQNAVATWQTMNVGKQTTLYFNQSPGTQSNGANSWVILNRIMDPSMAPSQILGSIKAEGSVYVVNRNGILFGPGSQVNVHSLVATSLDLLNQNDVIKQSGTDIARSNQLFLSAQGGLAALEASNVTGQTGAPNEVLGLGYQVKVNSPTDYELPGSVTIAPGASITTQTNGTASDGGFVLVAAPNVNNGGSITSTGGQVVLAAGVGVSLTPNPAMPQQLKPELSGQLIVQTGPVSSVDVTPAGALVNTGLIQAARGNVTLLGSSVQQNGVVGVTTSVNTPGSITISTVDEYYANTPTGTAYSNTGPIGPGLSGRGLDTHRAGLLSFGSDSVTTVMPDNDGQTATSAPGTVFTAGNITMTGGSIWFQSGSLIEAPGSTVSVAALTPNQGASPSVTPPGDTAVQGRIYLDTGATIDVSGLSNVALPIADTLVTVPRIGQNELADSPLLRNGFLFGLQNVVFDSTLTGTRSDGVQWVGSPLLNLSGYVNLIPRTIDQLLINGGTIILSGNEVMTAAGSSLNLNGGYIHYLGGMVNTTRLIDSNGAIVPIGQADPNDTFVGIAGQFVDNHPRWHITNTYTDPLLAGGTYEGDFIVGGNAGTLDLFASSAMVLDGDITAQALSGSKQVQGNDQATGGTFNLGADPALKLLGNLAGLTLRADTSITGQTGTIILQNSAPQLTDQAPDFSIDTPLDTDALNALSPSDPNNLRATTVVPTDTLAAGGFANVNLTANGTNSNGFIVAEGSQLVLQPGGSLVMKGGPSTEVLGSLIVPSGNISISSAKIVVGPDALLSVAGQWINNDTQLASDTTPGGSEYINGGSITLTSANTDLQAGSVIDVSSGGEMLANGQMLMENGIPVGEGGSLSLLNGINGLFSNDVPQSSGLTIDGTIRSFGFSGGGTLTLQANGFQIGGDPSSAPIWSFFLPTDFFSQQGFGSYVLNAVLDATVAPGAKVTVTQQNLMPNLPALQHAASGADLSTSGLTSVGTIEPYYRQPTSLVITAGGYVANHANSSQGGGPVPDIPGVTGAVTVAQGAAIVADAGANISLGLPTQVTVLGALIAPGGSITLSADSNGVLPGQSTGTLFTSDSKSVWLGQDAVLDVSGVALTNPLATPVRNGLTTFVPNTGKVLSGGTVSISDDSGYIVAEKGSVINVSGVSANFDQLQANGVYASQPVWSDAGSITLSATSGLYFDGTLQAHGGAPQAQGGTLTILPDANAVTKVFEPHGASTDLTGATALIIQQSGDLVPAGLAPGQSLADIVGETGVLQFSADRLDGSGVGTLVLGSPIPNITTNAVPPIIFSGNVDLSTSQAVIINSGTVAALSSEQVANLLPTGVPGHLQAPVSTLAAALTSGTPTDTDVTISAPYVAISGPFFGTTPQSQTTLPASGDGTLNVNASFIDLENAFQLSNFGQATFTSSGDIRLSSTNTSDTVLAPGVIYTPGNLTFKAADLYPSTGSTFVIDAVAPADSSGNRAPTTVTFESNGQSSVPLSAGGTLVVDATNIMQGGAVRAPSGSLIFGVGDPTDPNALPTTAYTNLPAVATDSVTFASGSLTSVSNDGSIIPYGTTVDGVEWQFNPIPSQTTGTPDLNAPPAKFISANGSSVALNAGATIDLSGGGDLLATEWVPGTGGTRDVLSQYNVSFASNPSGSAVPVNVGASNVYAIVPGAQTPVAAYDPYFAQTVQPSVNANGSAGTTTLSDGVGHAALNGPIGQSVYLSGVPGLPAGFYTLLPGKYATLPGAFRVTLATASGPVIPGASKTLPDGTVMVAGYFGNALDGSRSATPTLFNVQSGAVWQQYSQYTLTSANAFFPNLAASAGNVTPPLPVDAGHLVLAATNALALGAKLNTEAGPGGAPAEVDIASADIQILGNGEAGLQGYLQISADELDALGAGSLLIGGTRTQTNTGITIDAIANSVVVSNDAASPLTGPEILLVTNADPNSTDPNAANGLRIDAGSVIQAKGDYPAAKDVPITIGVAPDSSGKGGVSGDGALLRVSNGSDAVVTRLNTTDAATNPGILTVGAGATIAGGEALTLDSSGNLRFDPTAMFSGNSIAVDASAITFTNQSGEAAAALPGFVVSEAQLAQLSNAKEVILRSSGAMTFDGDVNVTFGTNVDLSAGTFTSDGGAATLNGQRIAFTNEIGSPTSAAGTAGSGTLTVNANEIDFGTGDKTTAGFNASAFNATGGIVGQNTGTFDFGAQGVTLSAPVYLADTSSDQTIETTGTLNLNANQGKALGLTPVGGALSFTGGTLNDNGATIVAPAGNVSLEATTGDLTVSNGSLVSATGVAKQFFDLTVFAPAGSISLIADKGSVNVQSGATLDFSGASGGGAAGSVTLSAPEQVVNLSGTIKGNAAKGYAGGSFSLDTGGAVDLDGLATVLAASGVNNSIAVQTNAGNLMLSAGNTLTAHSVSLTADGGAGNASDAANGNVIINGTINANGVATASGAVAGGTIDLYGKSSVDVEGTLLAESSDAYILVNSVPTANPNSTKLGGTINIGTSGTPTDNSYNAQYGYENVSLANSGLIKLGANARIDVSGGGALTVAANGLKGGVVNLRAPLLDDGTVNVTLGMSDPASQIVGARAVNMQAYAVWSTTDNTTGPQHFDGIVDPSGWYDSHGNLLAGTFTSQDGSTTITYTPGADGALGTFTTNGTTTAATADQLASDLENFYFAPSSANTDHETFYGYKDGDSSKGAGTLMGFVENGLDGVATQFANTGITNFAVVPGIELDNPSPSINDGDISILTPWNLGAGSSTDLAFRFHGEAPVITFRAENDVKVEASLSDGFFQIANPTGIGASIVAPGFNYTYSTEHAALYGPAYYYGGFYLKYGYVSPILAPAKLSGSSDLTSEYYALYHEYIELLLQPQTAVEKEFSQQGTGPLALLHVPNGAHKVNSWLSQPLIAGQPTLTVPYPTTGDPTQYLQYLGNYTAYLDSVITYAMTNGVTPHLEWVQPPPTSLSSVIAPGTVIVISPSATDNSPSPVPVAGNSLPLQSASLMGGNSTSFNIVAGANLASANPLALQAAALFTPSSGDPATENGSVILDGHFAFNNANNPNSPDKQTLLAPTTIRTGNGSISIAAGNDITLADTLAPGVIYTAGVPVAGTVQGGTASILPASPNQSLPDLIVSPTVSPYAAGDINVHAQGDITGVENVVDTTGALTGQAGVNISQFWWQWMQTNNQTGPVGLTTPTTQTVQTSINFGAFDQGIMSVGGNVSVSAGGDITNLAVSLPTTWYLTNATTDNPIVNTVGGGDLTVRAGGNILSGDYFVAKGTATISAGGQIGVGLSVSSNLVGQAPVDVAPLFALQDAVLNVSARQGVNVGGVFDPSYLKGGDGKGYSSTSAINVESTTGDVQFGTLNVQQLSSLHAIGEAGSVLPATVDLTAFTGGITVASGGELFPSATGNLNLIADQSVNLSSVSGLTVKQIGGATNTASVFGMLDVDPAQMPSPLDPDAIIPFPDDIGTTAHALSALHADDTDPVRIYSLNGSIIDGILEPAGKANAGSYDNLIRLVVDKPALLQAGQDILNLAFQGQNLRTDDVTRILAGRDILDTPLVRGDLTIPSLVLGGPGTFDVEAGRNIGPLSNEQDAIASNAGGVNTTPSAHPPLGIEAIGNAANPNLPHESANVQVLFGIGPGVDYATFISSYIDPASTVTGVPSSTPALIAFMEQYDAGLDVDTGFAQDKAAALAKVGTLTTEQAWSQFQALPSYVQQMFAQQVLFSVLTDVGNDFNNPSSPFFHQYARGYQAINTLFPASLGYTANNLDGGNNGANKLVDTGDLDIRSTTIQTQQGGNVSILGPGGQALIGSTSAPPEIVNASGNVVAGPSTMGILTLEQGDIDIFTDRSVLLAQSRIFTEQGGGMTIWSSNGDINAGKGAKSAADIPAPVYVCDVNHYCTVDARGEVTGAGIATLQTIPGAAPGNVNLIAPRGTVDAGDAGIRVSGNLNVAALHVANADNVQVQGTATGIPTVSAVDTGALTAASAAASAATELAQDLVKRNASGGAPRHWIISVRVEGFGDTGDDESKKRTPGQVSYDSSSAVSILGFGAVGQTQRAVLSNAERDKMGKI
ncbi:filamentous hemagglutinin family protein [Paraburkholderia humisilvae]|uniref:filamentous haemagglutinin family protein n=1 Tax=Paraburkholderia humisilvae TaxID=627669 RepID=UPI00361999CB